MNRPTLSASRLLDVLEYLVDDHVGIIRDVEEVPAESGEPALFYFYAQACNTRAFCRHKWHGKRKECNSRTGGGASVDRASALTKAVGEAVERYCSAIYDPEDLPLTSFDAAPFPCVQPDKFALYSREQCNEADFPFVSFQQSTPLHWTPAVDLESGETCYVPSAMVYVPYVYDRENGEQPIVQPISTGLACHVSQAQAVLSAICEVIERDAFTITWQARLARPQIRIETLSDRNRDLVARLERNGSSVTLLNLRMDHDVPTILAVLRSNNPEHPALVFAASSHLDVEMATRKSLEEVAHTRRLAQYFKVNRPPPRSSPNYDNIVDQDDHLHLYCLNENAYLADFIFESKERIDFRKIQSLTTGDPERDLEVLVERVGSVGHKVLMVDLTTPDVGEFGFSVVRAVIPGFHPLCMGHQLRALGGVRLWEVPQKLGYKGISRVSGDNPVPHPYP